MGSEGRYRGGSKSDRLRDGSKSGARNKGEIGEKLGEGRGRK